MSGAARGDRLPEEMIKGAIEKFLCARYNYVKCDITVEVGRTPAHAAPPLGAVTLGVELSGVDYDVRGKRLFYITTHADGHRSLKLAVLANIRVFKDVLVTSRILDRHEICAAGDFTIERREITQLRGEPVASIETAVHKRTVKIISPGKILCQRDIETPPSVERGDNLSVTLRRKNLTIDLKGEALEDGWPGDTIWVRLLEGNKRYLAEVLSPDQVVLR